MFKSTVFKICSRDFLLTISLRACQTIYPLFLPLLSDSGAVTPPPKAIPTLHVTGYILPFTESA